MQSFLAEGGMMPKGLSAIALIFLCSAAAWTVLGSTLLTRTASSDDNQSSRLSAQWGSSQEQAAPTVSSPLRGKARLLLPIAASRIDVGLNLEQRRKGLLWYNLYDVQFYGRYLVRNVGRSRRLTLRFALPSDAGTFSDFTCRIANRTCQGTVADNGSDVRFDLDPGRSSWIEIGYASRGRDQWLYRFGDGVSAVTDFGMNVTTNFDAIDFPARTLLPTSESTTHGGRNLRWHYAQLLTGNTVGITLPTPLQPGPLAARITFWAPVALLFYFFVLLIITRMRGVELHPVNYFFLACAFFAFHLLFAYLVDRISIGAAFTICSLTSMFLTITYLRLVAGWRFAAVESGLAQLVYLVLFSFALFNEGWSGLTITLGAIVTLFVAMQVTARIRWAEPMALPQA
jgi:Inner membrane protein CreD